MILGRRTAQSQLWDPGTCLCYRPVLSSGISPEGVSLPSRAGALWRAMKAPGFVSYQPVTLARSSSLNLFLCKMGSWCLLRFVTHVFNEICGVSGAWKGVALAYPPFSGSSRMKGYWRNLSWGVITAALANEGSLGYPVPPMGTGQLLSSTLWS